MNLDVLDEDNIKHRRLLAAVATSVFIPSKTKKFIVVGRMKKRCNAGYQSVVLKITNLKMEKPALFTRMFRLSPQAFDKVMDIIKPKLISKKFSAKNSVPPMVKLCLGLRLLAGASYLDLSFGYNVTASCVHHYAWQALDAIDSSMHTYLDNIKSPIHATAKELSQLELGFAELSDFKLRGTVAAGDGIVFRMQMPTNEEVDGDVTSYFTRKGYYAYGLQAFCDAQCRFVMISSQLCSSTNDNTCYIVTQLSKDIKAGRLPPQYHVVLDEAYPCMGQEMSPWKGRNLSVEKDAFNYYLSLNRQVIERAFGILVQRWGIFWRPLRLSMHNRGVAVRVACRLHNICIDDPNCSKVQPVRHGTVPGFEGETDFQYGDTSLALQFTDGTSIRSGYQSDLESCHHRDMWTNTILNLGLVRPTFSRYSKQTAR